MRILSLKLRNFLSFGEETQEIQFSDNTIIVGSNDAGKTNIFRAIELVGQILRNRSLSNSEVYDHNLNHKKPFEIEVKVRLDTDEIRALVDFLVCSFHTESVNVQKGEDQGVITEMIQKIVREGAYEVFSELFHEIDIIIKSESRRVYGHDVRFRFNKNSKELLYANYSFTKNPDPRGSRTLSRLIDLMLQKIRTTNPRIIQNYPNDKSIRLPKLRRIMPSLFDFIYDVLPENSSNTVDITGFHMDQFEQKQLAMSNLLNLREFVTSRWPNENQGMGISDIISIIYNSSIVKTSDIRSRPKTSLNFIDLDSKNGLVNLTGDDLPLILHRLRNSNDPLIKNRYDMIVTAFKEITGNLKFDVVIRDVKVSSEQKTIFGIMPSPESILHSDGFLPVGAKQKETEVIKHEALIQIIKNNMPIPLDLTAAGRFEILVLLTSLTGLRNKIILLDEPAANLHPMSQKKIIQIFKDAITKQQNQIIIITHSPYMINPDDTENIWKISPTQMGTKVINLKKTMESLEIKEEKKIVQQFRNPEIRSILFSQGVILVEGPSDKVVLEKIDRHISENNQNGPNLEEKEWSILDVNGKDSMVLFINMLSRLNVPHIAVFDYDALMRCEKKIKFDDKEIRTSSVPYYIYATSHLSTSEIILLQKLEKSIKKTINHKGNEELWYDKEKLSILTKLAKSHKMIVLTKDLEGILQNPVTAKDRKPLQALDRITELIIKNKIPDEFKSVMKFIKYSMPVN